MSQRQAPDGSAAANADGEDAGAASNEDFGEVGPKEGERFPDVPLSDPIGLMVDLREARAEWQAIVVSTGARNGDRSADARIRALPTAKG